MGCSNLVGIAIPNGVASIESYAFNDCSSLTEIVIPDSVTSIGTCAFNNCFCLTKIEIPDSMRNIGYGAFSGCSNLNEIKIYNTYYIDSSAFDGCLNLKVILFARNPPSLIIGSYYNPSDFPSSCRFYVPDEMVTTYKQSDGWSEYASQIYPLSAYKDKLLL